MIWTNWGRLWNEGAIYRECDPPDYRLKQTVRRERQLTDRRLELARLESAALRERLDEERLVADTVIRSMRMRIDNAERIVEVARSTLKSILPGAHNYIANPTAFVRLVELIAERDRHQFAPHATDEAERAASPGSRTVASCARWPRARGGSEAVLASPGPRGRYEPGALHREPGRPAVDQVVAAMIWTDAVPFYVPMGGSESFREYDHRWWRALLSRRVELARMEAEAWEMRWRLDMTYQAGIEVVLRERINQLAATPTEEA